MATLQKKSSRGRTYWYLVESRRVGGKPRPVVLAYLGRADDLLGRLRGIRRELRLRSVSHGLVAALKQAADELRLGELLDEIADRGRRREDPTVGEALLVAAVLASVGIWGRHGGVEWQRRVADTSVARVFGLVDRRVTRRRLQGRMARVRAEVLVEAGRAVARRALAGGGGVDESLAYVVPCVLTTGGERAVEGRRRGMAGTGQGTRRAGLSLLVSQADGIPLAHDVGEDAWQAARSLSRLSLVAGTLGRRVEELGGSRKGMTLVCGGEGFTRLHQRRVDLSPFRYVTTLDALEHRKVLRRLEGRADRVETAGGEVPVAIRSRWRLWGADRTLVAVFSDSLRQQQLRRLSLSPIASPRSLIRGPLGSAVLMTDRHEWSTADIIRAAGSRASAEELSARIAGAWPPGGGGWRSRTEPLLKVYSFCCVLGRLLEKVVERKARCVAGYEGSLQRLLEELAAVREVTVTEGADGRGRPRVRTQLEMPGGEVSRLAGLLGIGS